MVQHFTFTKPVLAFDTAFGGCVAAVLDPKTGAAVQRVLPTDRGQSLHLMPLICEVVKEAGLSFGDLGLVVANPGPGSFTGLRISLITAKSLALSLGIPVQGADSFRVMAQGCVPETEGRNMLVVLESKRADFYARKLGPDFSFLGDGFCALADAFTDEAYQGSILCGDGVARLEKEVGADLLEKRFAARYAASLLDPVLLAKEGLALFEENGGKVHKLEPIYLRDPDVSAPKTQYRHIKDF